MPDITIRVRNRIAETVGSPEIICGNDGYNLLFDLDEEWSAQEIKTARIAWTDTFSGQPRHTDVPFILGFAAIPAIADAYEVRIGLYSGNIMTTTPATVPCVRCITDGETYHEDPEPDTYAALLELLKRITQGGVTVGDTTVLLDGIDQQAVGLPEFPDITTMDLLEEPYLSTVQNGSLTDNTGQPVSRADRAACYSYIDVPDGSTRFKVDIAISGTAGKYFVDLYDENENYLYSATSSTDPLAGVAYYSFTNSGAFRSVHSDAKKIRTGVRNASNSNFSASSITEFKITFL